MDKSFVRTAQGTFNLAFVTMILQSAEGLVLHFADGTEVALPRDEGERLTKLMPHILAMDLLAQAPTTIKIPTTV